jgi:hypothetical protein
MWKDSTSCKCFVIKWGKASIMKEMDKLLKLFIDNSWQCLVSAVSWPLHKKTVSLCDKLKSVSGMTQNLLQAVRFGSIY